MAKHKIAELVGSLRKGRGRKPLSEDTDRAALKKSDDKWLPAIATDRATFENADEKAALKKSDDKWLPAIARED